VTALLANIVFPAFSIFNPWIPAVALGCEFLAFVPFQFRIAPWWLIVLAFLAANAASTIIGFVVCDLIPVPVAAIRPAWGFIAFVPAYLLTVLIEYDVYRRVARWRALARPLAASVTTNAVSYSFIALACWRHWAD
jgi:hypothetical protein